MLWTTFQGRTVSLSVNLELSFNSLFFEVPMYLFCFLKFSCWNWDVLEYESLISLTTVIVTGSLFSILKMQIINKMRIIFHNWLIFCLRKQRRWAGFSMLSAGLSQEIVYEFIFSSLVPFPIPLLILSVCLSIIVISTFLNYKLEEQF